MKSNDLTPYEKDAQLIAEVAGQVIRDFERFQLDIIFSGNTEKAYVELHSQIAEIIDELSKTNPGKCTSLLYRIDIHEQLTVKALQQPSFPDAMARLIIQRELQKVILRKHFK